ncbi:Uma2 family endonuclease [cf. Phormidesmis sp. LEGE 11477]|uniref:Uma2 family endonuclease n=1 Tax=cf. Phormidesmis sp. LEGE 11477 TaxID=1828680 RepID=UPI001882E8D8|nr:Uma2 family endonuclease [cf. Phormidesmis sp. LEGE 11477]MBE9060775.1 Uma2 family endonuclease [cf. Phormidesmis sp. LEGE 11477]
MTALILQMPPSTKLSDEQFYELCRINRDIRIERTANGELILMPPTDGETGTRNAGINAQLWIWNESKGLGKVFDSSTAFKLPNGADRAPDASWVLLERWNALTTEQKEKFPPICPHFVVELRSKTDRLSILQTKMQEYIDNGARLGWLINRKDSQVEIYRPRQEVKVLNSPSSVSGESVLPGFELKLKGIL